MSEPMDFKSLKALKKKMQEESQQRYLDESKKRLAKIIETQLKTHKRTRIYERNLGKNPNSSS